MINCLNTCHQCSLPVCIPVTSDSSTNDDLSLLHSPPPVYLQGVPLILWVFLIILAYILDSGPASVYTSLCTAFPSVEIF